MAFLLNLKLDINDDSFMANAVSAGTTVPVKKQYAAPPRFGKNFLNLHLDSSSFGKVPDGMCHHFRAGWGPKKLCVFCTTGLSKEELGIIEPEDPMPMFSPIGSRRKPEPFRTMLKGTRAKEDLITLDCPGRGVCDGSCVERSKDEKPMQSKLDRDHRPYKPSYKRAQEKFERELQEKGILRPADYDEEDPLLLSPRVHPDSSPGSFVTANENTPGSSSSSAATSVSNKKPGSALRPPPPPPPVFELDQNTHGVAASQEQQMNELDGSGSEVGHRFNISFDSNSASSSLSAAQYKWAMFDDSTEYVRSPSPELRHPSPVKSFATPLAHTIDPGFDTCDSHLGEEKANSDKTFATKVFDDYVREDVEEKMRKTYGYSKTIQRPKNEQAELQDAEMERLMLASLDEGQKLDATELMLLRELRKTWRIKGFRANEASRRCVEIMSALYPNHFRTMPI